MMVYAFYNYTINFVPMKNSLNWLLIAPLLTLGTMVYGQCDSTEHVMSGKLITNTSRNVKIELEDETDLPRMGQTGTLSKYFESNLFGFKSTGWLTIATIEIVSYNWDTHAMTVKVIEEQSEMIINGKKKNHFERGNLVKFEWKTAPRHEMYHKIEGGDTIVRGVLFCGKREGEWKYFYRGGVLQEVDNYKNGEAHGAYTSYYPDGTIAETGFHIEGKRDGKMTLYHPSGEHKKVVHYKEGIKHGIYQKYYKEGTLEYEVTYVDDVISGPFKNCYHNGNIKEEGTLKEGKITGQLTGYYIDGEKYFVSGFEDDKKHGSYVKYHKNGHKYEEGTYDMGKLEGHFTEYFQNGQISYSCNYSKDKLNGEYVSHYKSGGIKMQGKYINGTKIGFWEEYYEDGKPKAQGHFDDHGNKTGKWFNWTSKGKRTKTKY